MSSLFAPIEVGHYALAHRVVMAPLTRMRPGPGDATGASGDHPYRRNQG